VGLISSDMQSRAKDLVKEQQILMKNDQARYRNETTKACKFAAKTLSKVSPEEAVGYKEMYNGYRSKDCGGGKRALRSSKRTGENGSQRDQDSTWS